MAYIRRYSTAKSLFLAGTTTIERKPRALITDGLTAYRIAARKLWYSRYKANQVGHVQHVTFKGDYNNDRME